jgi:hypothetical protein
LKEEGAAVIGRADRRALCPFATCASHLRTSSCPE